MRRSAVGLQRQSCGSGRVGWPELQERHHPAFDRPVGPESAAAIADISEEEARRRLDGLTRRGLLRLDLSRSGPPDQLMDAFGLSAKSIVKTVKELVG